MPFGAKSHDFIGYGTLCTAGENFGLRAAQHNASRVRRGTGGRAVECTGLENRRGCKPTVGSNPTLSATLRWLRVAGHPQVVRLQEGIRKLTFLVAQ